MIRRETADPDVAYNLYETDIENYMYIFQKTKINSNIFTNIFTRWDI